MCISKLAHARRKSSNTLEYDEVKESTQRYSFHSLMEAIEDQRLKHSFLKKPQKSPKASHKHLEVLPLLIYLQSHVQDLKMANE
jgi:hypothetical protein